MAEKGPDSEVWPLHETLVELLRRLNRMSEHAESVDGMELREIERSMYHFWVTRTHEVDLHGALALLVENGLVKVVEEPAFASGPEPVVGERFLITSNGKSYLNRQVHEGGRIA